MFTSCKAANHRLKLAEQMACLVGSSLMQTYGQDEILLVPECGAYSHVSKNQNSSTGMTFAEVLNKKEYTLRYWSVSNSLGQAPSKPLLSCEVMLSWAL